MSNGITSTTNPFMRNAQAEYFAQNPDEYRKLLDQQQTAQRRQGALRLGAGALDFFKGRRGVKDAEAQLDELTGQATEMRDELRGMRAPGSMDPSTVAEATRNAAIIGFQDAPSDPSDELANQAMALESGADPTKLYSAAAQADQAQDAQERLEAQSNFQQGLQTAQTDALNRFKQDYQQKAGELGDVESEIAGAEQALANAELQKQRGTAGLVQGGQQFAQYGGIDQIKNKINDLRGAMGGQTSTEPPVETNQTQADGTYNFGDYSTAAGTPLQGFGLTPGALQGDTSGISLLNQAEGGSVQQTPGEYDHDTNDMILMAQGRDGMLVDTGIRQTGGEYVIDPFDAGNMRQAHEKIDPVELEMVRQGKAPMTEELSEQLMRMYDAVRFISEPQFDDDYYEKKMSSHA